MDETQPVPNAEAGRRLPAWQTSPTWWFRWIGLPLVVIMGIAAAMIWLQRPEDEIPRRVAEADAPLEADTAAPQEGQPAPDFTLRTLDGGEIRLGDLRGKIVVLNFWATWCGPCREEMPLLEQAMSERGPDGLVIVAINVQESEAQVRPFVQRLNLTYPIGMDRNGCLARRYRVRSYPTTYFISRDGAIEGRRVGAYTRQILFGRLSQLLDE
jgi:thiol-disulfide isomerase/thioredoxin